MAFVKATRTQKKARIALMGPSGSGKTLTALLIATGLGKKIAVIDTEAGSASLYADKVGFDIMTLTVYHPSVYKQAIDEAVAAGYDVIVIDSISHEWSGAGGCLEIKDNSKSLNSYTAWKDITPLHNALIEKILQCPVHVICTMRVKTEYALQLNDRNKQVPVKLGLGPVQRDGMEYEYDVIGSMDQDHTLTITKTRYDALDALVLPRPNKDVGLRILGELSTGDKAPPAPVVPKSMQPCAPAKPAYVFKPMEKESRALIAKINGYQAQSQVSEWLVSDCKKSAPDAVFNYAEIDWQTLYDRLIVTAESPAFMGEQK